MTRTIKIQKLANAIREYRGATAGTRADAPIWKYPPKPKAMQRIMIWLDRLKLDYLESADAIDNFKSYDEFNAWLKTIS